MCMCLVYTKIQNHIHSHYSHNNDDGEISIVTEINSDRECFQPVLLCILVYIVER